MLKKQLSFVALILALLVGGVLTASLQAETNPPMRSKTITYVPEQVETFQTRNAFGQIHGSHRS